MTGCNAIIHPGGQGTFWCDGLSSVISLSVCLSLSFYLSLSVSLSVCVSLSLSLSIDRHHGTPMLLEGVRCIGVELESIRRCQPSNPILCLLFPNLWPSGLFFISAKPWPTTPQPWTVRSLDGENPNWQFEGQRLCAKYPEVNSPERFLPRTPGRCTTTR
jgi:hypothetical protein